MILTNSPACLWQQMHSKNSDITWNFLVSKFFVNELITETTTVMSQKMLQSLL